MHREYHKWYSQRLGRDMELLVHGHAGLPVIVFPSSQGRFYEFEDRGMIGSIAYKIDNGEVQLYCLDSVDAESWYNRNVPPRWRIARHMTYESYVTEEVLPLIRNKNWSPKRITPGLQLWRLPCGQHRAAPSRQVHRIPFDERGL